MPTVGLQCRHTCSPASLHIVPSTPGPSSSLSICLFASLFLAMFLALCSSQVCLSCTTPACRLYWSTPSPAPARWCSSACRRTCSGCRTTTAACAPGQTAASAVSSAAWCCQHVRPQDNRPGEVAQPMPHSLPVLPVVGKAPCRRKPAMAAAARRPMPLQEGRLQARQQQGASRQARSSRGPQAAAVCQGDHQGGCPGVAAAAL